MQAFSSFTLFIYYLFSYVIRYKVNIVKNLPNVLSSAFKDTKDINNISFGF